MSRSGKQLVGIPDELIALSQWVLWRFEERDKEATKVPYGPRTGSRASTTNPATWGSFDQALEALDRGGYDGPGFVFSASDPYCGIDLDGCIGEDGAVEEWALEIVKRLDSFTEISPSGRGLHIFVRGKLPEGGRRKGKIEMYDEGRYFTVTGREFLCPD